MEPKCTDQRQAPVMCLTTKRVGVGQKLITQLEIFAAEGLDFCIVKLVGIYVSIVLIGPHLAGVPAPGQTKVPGPTVSAKRRTERTELKPADIQFAGQLASWIKTADVGAPIRRQAEPVVLTDWHVGCQRFPTTVDVARPDPAAISRYASVASTLKIPRTHVRPVQERPLIIQSVPSYPRLAAEFITVIWPPAIDAQCKGFSMPAP